MSQCLAAIRAKEARDTDVSTSRMFGTDCLKFMGKVYAMEFKGALVVKLSKARTAALVAEGQAEAFDPGHGRPMKQWVAVRSDSALDWAKLVQEAKVTVGSG